MQKTKFVFARFFVIYIKKKKKNAKNKIRFLEFFFIKKCKKQNSFSRGFLLYKKRKLQKTKFVF